MVFLSSLALIAVADYDLPELPDDVGEDEDAEVVQHDRLGVLRAQPLGEGAVADHFWVGFVRHRRNILMLVAVEVVCAIFF